MKSWMKWTGIALLALALAAGAYRALTARQASKLALQAQADALKTPQALELADGEIITATTVNLMQTIPLAGPLKATRSAVVKVRVSGELQELSVREGDFVKAGQVIARVDATESQARLRQAQQQAESARAQVDIARRSFENNRSLVEQGFISRTALESSTSALAAAEATYRAAQAGAEVATKALEDTVLRAPIAGQVAQRLAQPGERVAVDFRIVEIVDLSRMELEASISATEALEVRVGQTAQLALEGSAKSLQATVIRINPSATTASRAVLVYLALDNTAGLRQGLFVQGTLTTGSTRQLAVPLESLRTDKPLPYIQWIQDGRVKHQTVVPGVRGEANGQPMVAVHGITDGAQILAGSVGVIREGTSVQPKAGKR